jgi:hypothetical protein
MAAVGFGAGTLLISVALWRSFATQWDLLDYVMVSQELRYWAISSWLWAGWPS